jgi:hypothetical protein
MDGLSRLLERLRKNPDLVIQNGVKSKRDFSHENRAMEKRSSLRSE